MPGPTIVRAVTPAPRQRLRVLCLALAAYLALAQAVLPIVDPWFAGRLPYHAHVALGGPVSPSHLHAHELERAGIDAVRSAPNAVGSRVGDAVMLSPADGAVQAFVTMQASPWSAEGPPWPRMLTLLLAPTGVRALAGLVLAGPGRPPALG